MQHLATALALSAAVLLSGCGGVRPGSMVSTSPGTSPATTPPVTPSLANFTGNWQLSGASIVPGKPPFTIAGSISQAGSAVSGALHVNGSNCFNQVTTMGLTGTVTADGISMASSAIDGQVLTLTGNYINTIFTGTFSINGGCDDGDKGTFTGVNVYVGNADSWGGIFTSSAQGKFNVSGSFGQSSSASSDGSFGLTGTATFDTPCFNAATLSPGSFPSGSFILGTLVSIQIKTNNGTVAFLGTVDPGTEYMSGAYTVSGGTCDQTGTAVVALTGQWDY